MQKYIFRKISCLFKIVVIFLLTIIITNDVKYDSMSVATVLNDNVNKALDVSVIKDSQDEIYSMSIYSPLYTFSGDLTGYSGDCPLCTGYLACPPRTNVIKYGIYYNDKTYGNIRIVASSKKYPCGTILRFNVSKLSDEPIIAIVLDRGVGGNDIDLLSEDSQYATQSVGRVKNQTFEVLREGWSR